MREYFPESKSLGGDMKVELDLSNYAAGIDTSYLLLKSLI